MSGRRNLTWAPAAKPAVPAVSPLDQPLDELVTASRPRQGTKRGGNSGDNGHAAKKARPNEVYDEEFGLAETSESTRGPVLKSLDMASVDVAGRHRVLVDKKDAANGDFEAHNAYRTVGAATTTQNLAAIVTNHMARSFRQNGGRQMPMQIDIKNVTKGDIKMINKKYRLKSEGSEEQQAEAIRAAARARAIEAAPAEPTAQLEAAANVASKPAAQQQATRQYSGKSSGRRRPGRGQNSGRGQPAGERKKNLVELDEELDDYFASGNQAKSAAEVASLEAQKAIAQAEEAEEDANAPQDWEY